MEQKKPIQLSLKILIAFIVILVVAIIATAVIVNNDNNKVETNKPNNSVIEKNNSNADFALKFLKPENKKENIIYSPLSIKYALKMINEGANGNTKTEIENVIGNLDVTKYDNIDRILSLANGIYIKDDFANNVKPEFQNRLVEKYNVEVKYDDFSSADNINKWIEDKTLGIIKDTVEDETVQDLEMLLINALAIDMEWEEKFNVSERRPFYLIEGKTMIADMLVKEETKSNSVSYYQNNNVTALAMDLKRYNDVQLEFMAIMPNKDLNTYIENFTTDELNKITNKLTLASETKNGLHIYMLEFRFEYELALKEDLIKLGIRDMFGGNADLSNISDARTYVSEAIHKATIDVKRDGIKAAAVTGLGLRPINAKITKSKEIKIDKPFMFIIRDKNTGEIWFTGALYKPNIV